MFFSCYIFVLIVCCFSYLAVNDDLFEWWKDDDNILSTKEVIYSRHEQNEPNLERQQINVSQHQTTLPIEDRTQDLDERKEYWKRRRLDIMKNDPERHKKDSARRRMLDKERRYKAKAGESMLPKNQQKSTATRRRQWEERKMKQRPLTYEHYIKEKEMRKGRNKRYRMKLKAGIIKSEASTQQKLNPQKIQKTKKSKANVRKD